MRAKADTRSTGRCAYPLSRGRLARHLRRRGLDGQDVSPQGRRVTPRCADVASRGGTTVTPRGGQHLRIRGRSLAGVAQWWASPGNTLPEKNNQRACPTSCCPAVAHVELMPINAPSPLLHAPPAPLCTEDGPPGKPSPPRATSVALRGAGIQDICSAPLLRCPGSVGPARPNSISPACW